MAGQSPQYWAAGEYNGEADEAFTEAVTTAVQEAADRIGVPIVVTADASEVDRLDRAWTDRDALQTTWQSVWDEVDVDVDRLACEALDAVGLQHK